MKISRIAVSIFWLMCIIPTAWSADAERYEAFVIGRKGVEPQFQAIVWRLDRYTGELKQCFVDKDFSYDCIERTSKELTVSDGRSLRFDLDKWWNNNNKGLGYLGAVRIDRKTGEIVFCGSQVSATEDRACHQITP